MAAKYLLRTLGCKVNQYESQQTRELVESLGMRPAQPGETPDLAIVNTCAVTANASRRSRQVVRRASRGGHTSVVVVGCGASAEASRLHELGGVAAVLGHDTDTHANLRRLIVQQLKSLPTQPHAYATSVADAMRRPPGANLNDGSMMPAVSGAAPRTTAPRAST